MGCPGEGLRVNHVVKVTRAVYWPEKLPPRDTPGGIRTIYRGKERVVYVKKGEKGKIVAIFRDGSLSRKTPFAKIRMKDGEVKDIALGLLKRASS